MRHGYACINLTLAERKVQVNRSMMKRSYLEKGLGRASELALANIIDLEKIMDWNIEHGLLLYRMSSDMFPWMSEYEIHDLPDFDRIGKILQRCGDKAASAGLRLTYHPGPFNVLASNNAGVVERTIKELRQHGEIMDLLGRPRSSFAKINIHVGASYGDKKTAMERFAENFQRLPDAARSRLTIENDDKANMFSVHDLLWLHEQVGIPIVFDYFHHTFCTGGLDEPEALIAALSTWPKGIVPIVHFSSPKRLEDATAAATAHADMIHSSLDTYGYDVDVMLEAKAKELAVLEYLGRTMHELA
jgi:UV DNA damage endonuclease